MMIIHQCTTPGDVYEAFLLPNMSHLLFISRSDVLPAGVIDDRGKFISITPAELDSVADFIRQRGRVSISELAQASNSLINLTPKSSSAA